MNDLDATISLMLMQLHEAAYVVDRDGDILLWNDAASDLLGIEREQAVGSKCNEHFVAAIDQHGCSLCKGDCPIRATIADGIPRQSEAFIRHGEGHRIHVSVRSTPIRDPQGHIIAAAKLLLPRDNPLCALTGLEQLRDLAYRDHLTGLANRRAAEQVIADHLRRCQDQPFPFGILMGDLDHFKQVNDRFGHPTGDRLLKAVSRTMSQNVSDGDLVARWGGEEFLILLRGASDHTRLAQQAQRLGMLVQATQVYYPDQPPIHTTISFGGTLVQSGDTLESITQRADKQLYESKINERNRASLAA